MKIKHKNVDNPRYSSNQSITDFLFILLCCITLFFILTLIDIKKKNEGIEHKAEFVITLTWNEEDKNDMDLWLKDPQGNIIYYKDKESPAMYLDRDDLGHQNDAITINGVTRIIKINQEIISIRAIVPGRWIVAVHFFKRKDKNPEGTPVPVEIQMNKLNPKITIIFKENKTMNSTWQESTVAIFDMLPDGTIKNLELYGSMPMVHERIPVPMHGPDAPPDSQTGNYHPDYSDNGVETEEHRNIEQFQSENLEHGGT